MEMTAKVPKRPSTLTLALTAAATIFVVSLTFRQNYNTSVNLVLCGGDDDDVGIGRSLEEEELGDPLLVGPLSKWRAESGVRFIFVVF